MSYYFECKTCKKKEVFVKEKKDYKYLKYKKQDYETVICTNCISKKLKLKGNYIII